MTLSRDPGQGTSCVTRHVTAPALHNIVPASHHPLPADEAPWQDGYEGSWGCQTTACEGLVLLLRDMTTSHLSEVSGYSTIRCGPHSPPRDGGSHHQALSVCCWERRGEWTSVTDCKTATTRTDNQTLPHLNSSEEELRWCYNNVPIPYKAVFIHIAQFTCVSIFRNILSKVIVRCPVTTGPVSGPMSRLHPLTLLPIDVILLLLLRPPQPQQWVGRDNNNNPNRIILHPYCSPSRILTPLKVLPQKYFKSFDFNFFARNK